MQLFFAGIASAALLVASVAFTNTVSLFGNRSDSHNNNSNLSLDWEHEVTSSKCTPPVVRRGDNRHDSEPIINVVERVKNDADSGVAGNYWAFDNFSRRIQVWRTATTTFCAVVKYEGSFKAIAGQITPAGTSTLTGKEKGEFDGGYRATITGTLLATSTWQRKGSVGTIEYNCDASGNCPGYINWTTQYFAAGVVQNLDWWGWIYHGGRYGTWINAVVGNQGNIISPPPKSHTGPGWGSSNNSNSDE